MPDNDNFSEDEVKSFLDSAGKKIDKNGQYTGPKIDVFGKTRKV